MTILVSSAELSTSEVLVAGAAYRHHFRARRLRTGDRVRLTDGEGRAHWAEVLAVGKSSARLSVGEAAPLNEPWRDVHLLVATPRPERAAWLVEKATELGVRRVVLVAAERAPRQPGASTLARLQRLADAALEQSQGARRTVVEGVVPWAQLVAGLSAFAQRWVLTPEGGAMAAPRAAPGACALLVGPEGGWTAPELADLRAAGCRAVVLGRRTLRIETAAIAAAVLALTPP